MDADYWRPVKSQKWISCRPVEESGHSGIQIFNVPVFHTYLADVELIVETNEKHISPDNMIVGVRLDLGSVCYFNCPRYQAQCQGAGIGQFASGLHYKIPLGFNDPELYRPLWLDQISNYTIRVTLAVAPKQIELILLGIEQEPEAQDIIREKNPIIDVNKLYHGQYPRKDYETLPGILSEKNIVRFETAPYNTILYTVREHMPLILGEHSKDSR